MAKIPTGNFGFDAPSPASQADTSAISRGLGDLVQGLAAVQQRKVNEARAAAANAYLDHQIAAKNAAQDVADKLSTGDLTPDNAEGDYQKTVSALKRPEIANLPSTDAQNLDRQFKRNVEAGADAVKRAADGTRRALFKDQFNQGLDKLGKLAGMPGADIEGINQQAAAFAEVGRNAGVPPAEVERAIQNFKDQNWLNEATQRSMESAEDMGALNQLQHDLTAKDGKYAEKLDTDKRNAVLQSVLSRKAQLEARLEHAADRREARAGVAMNEIDRQIASGVPATPDMWATWATVVHGTTFAPEFKSRIEAEEQVQAVLREPIADQVKYVQERETKLLSKGGTLREAANFARLKEAVTANVNLMQQAPLQFNANRTGQEVAPLDISSLDKPDSTEVAAQLHERVVTLDAMRKQYGEQVPMRPLLPQEAAVLSTALNKATAEQGVQLFATLRNAVGSDDAYKGIMQQIAPDSPVKAYAGLLAAKQRSVTLERNWVRSDVIASSPDVAGTMLKGLEILRPSKNEKGQDGAPKVGLYLPPAAEASLQTEFQAQVGAAFADRPDAADQAFQAVKAYYVGKASQTGRIASGSTDADSAIAKEAITATLGEVVDYNGRGEVLAPWGMDASTFEDRVQQAFIVEAKKRGLPDTAVQQLPALGLINEGDGTYYVKQGRNFIYGRDGKGMPLVINVLDPTANPPPPAPYRLDWGRVK